MNGNQAMYPVTGHGRATASARVVMAPPTSVIFGAGVCPQSARPSAVDLSIFRLDAKQFRSEQFRTRNDKTRSGFSVWIPPA
jgi:hypothetical protein